MLAGFYAALMTTCSPLSRSKLSDHQLETNRTARSECSRTAAATLRALSAGRRRLAFRLSAHVFQETTHGIELRAETGPISGFQALDRRIIKLECLARLFRGGACKRGRAAGCRRFGATLRKQRRQRRCERLFHHDLIAI